MKCGSACLSAPYGVFSHSQYASNSRASAKP